MAKSVRIIGVPLDLGANMRGAIMGPAAIRMAELKARIEGLDIAVHDSGDLAVPVRESLSDNDRTEKYLSAIVRVCEEIAAQTLKATSNNEIPLVIGGDHSIAVGSVSGVAAQCRNQKKDLGILWIDAHADINTHDTSPSGNIHGMPLASLLGLGDAKLRSICGDWPKVKPENVVLLGIRNIDGKEKEALRQSGVHYYTMREVDERGMHATMLEALDKLSKATGGIHLSCDLDGIDPLYAPGVSTPVTGGLSYREVHLALEMLADTGLLQSLDLVELNPTQDMGHKTADLAVDLALSALGKSIV